MEVSTPAGWSNLTYASLAVMAGLGVSWLLFQKNKLPPHLQKIAGRFFFYPTLPISLPLYYARGDYWSTIEGQLYYGAIPLSLFGHPDKMKSMGITAVVNLCDEYAGPVSDYERIGIEQLYTPVVDHNSPDQEEIEKCISFIDRKLREGKKVLIHCKAGHGRSAAVAFCWYLYVRRATLEKSPEKKEQVLAEVQKLLLKHRSVRKKLWNQANIRQYYDSLVRKNNTSSSNDQASGKRNE